MRAIETPSFSAGVSPHFELSHYCLVFKTFFNISIFTSSISIVCQNCYRYRLFNDKCWYYWAFKKECSRFVDEENSPGGYKSVKRKQNTV